MTARLASYIEDNTHMSHHAAQSYAFAVGKCIEIYGDWGLLEWLVEALADLSGLDITDWLAAEYKVDSLVDDLKARGEVDITSV